MSVVVVKYKEPFKIINECIESLKRQKNINLEIVFLDQSENKNYKEYLERSITEDIDFKYQNIPDISLSYGRNIGVKLSSSKFVAFSDPDCILDENWAFELYRILENDENIGIVGGKVLPKWCKKPKWYHKSRIIRELYSLIDLSDKIQEVNKIVGANFAVNKKIVGELGGFNEELGRKKGTLLGGEETELCERVIQNGYKVVYNPFAVALHQIPDERITLKWVIKRLFYAGMSRALRGGSPKTFHKERNYYDYIILPLLLIYLIGFLIGKIFKTSDIHDGRHS